MFSPPAIDTGNWLVRNVTNKIQLTVRKNSMPVVYH